ncbi:MerR family transcriptional regulator [Cronobacter sakazakii]|uniref:MerR family transcriptional regulator n=1 Tax=Cronobacter sakazakii TaxID=28141 RepID=A0AA44Z811_CROSK|nr:MerR family transcriptional regulator [Cronobacter sakazakii]EIZ8955503.1 MerR family transcriptional regulator [Cronobacter sakazakii]EKM1390702.1 MerR family transcriptional regulator [Cronobacter sakazakii]EKM6438439.1 MerR family transcriptional regulator [Cronobacter sakazakii]ELY3575281.1 MerR family transcriptional regulator [Cronobacter sakazakii]ELY6333261.1 MerR family transcriptional regulator [Cronobacter sakazakii]
MRIQAFATLTGLGVHTLRYYEKLGLLVPARNASGHRDYSRSDLDWAAFIKRLKATAMPLEEIQRYALLRAQGETTAGARHELLAHHAQRLEARLAEQADHLVRLKEKMAYYDETLLKNSA